MLALAVIVLMFLSCGLFFLGHFSTAKNNAVNNLSFQMITFERQTAKYFEDMTRMGNSLSESLAKETDAFSKTKAFLSNRLMTMLNAFILFRTTFSINWVQNC